MAKTILRLAGALAIVAASFFVTLRVLNNWTEAKAVRQLLREPAYDAAKLPHLKPTQPLNFSTGQNRSALLSGWSGAEPSGVWSDSHAAFVAFVMDGGTGLGTPKTIIVRANPFLQSTKRQRVQVWSGGTRLAEYDLKDPSAELAIPLAGITIGNGTPVVLGFYLPDAISPAMARVGNDRRELALFITSLQLMP